ncbi:MAG: LPXTG cell wall anchor domain-containing protein [Oscillospiraceae bacterium]|nr:LPXTG cell wall anchor domain-containing protein [Oscillospiraceae bacterium]
MSYKKKAAAALCAAAAIVMAAASAVTAFAFETVKMDARKDEIVAGKINIVADQVYAKPGEEVKYQVHIAENSGYAGIGVELYYDEKLVPAKLTDIKADMTFEDAVYGMSCDQTINLPKNLIAFTAMSDTDHKAEGALYTVKFTVPADAAAGTKYPLTLKITDIYNESLGKLDYNTVDGWIEVKVPETTTQPTATTAAPTDATVPTATTGKTDETAGPTQTTSLTTVTGELITDVSTVSSTKKTSRDPSKNVTTSANGNNNNNNQHQNNTNKNNNTKTDGVKTGDSGVAVALAALLLAGSSAVIFGRRKKD